jgi:hypothetical protein
MALTTTTSIVAASSTFPAKELLQSKVPTQKPWSLLGGRPRSPAGPITLFIIHLHRLLPSLAEVEFLPVIVH